MQFLSYKFKVAMRQLTMDYNATRLCYDEKMYVLYNEYNTYWQKARCEQQMHQLTLDYNAEILSHNKKASVLYNDYETNMQILCDKLNKLSHCLCGYDCDF